MTDVLVSRGVLDYARGLERSRALRGLPTLTRRSVVEGLILYTSNLMLGDLHGGSDIMRAIESLLSAERRREFFNFAPAHACNPLQSHLRVREHAHRRAAVFFLLRAGARADGGNADKVFDTSPAALAIAVGAPDCLDLLLRYGAATTARMKGALFLCCSRGRPERYMECARVLVRSQPMWTTRAAAERDGVSDAHDCALLRLLVEGEHCRRRLDLLDLLLKAGAADMLDWACDDGAGGLHRAVDFTTPGGEEEALLMSAGSPARVTGSRVHVLLVD